MISSVDYAAHWYCAVAGGVFFFCQWSRQAPCRVHLAEVQSHTDTFIVIVTTMSQKHLVLQPQSLRIGPRRTDSRSNLTFNFRQNWPVQRTSIISARMSNTTNAKSSGFSVPLLSHNEFSEAVSQCLHSCFPEFLNFGTLGGHEH